MGGVEERMPLPMTFGFVVTTSAAPLAGDFERGCRCSHFEVVMSDRFASVGCVWISVLVFDTIRMILWSIAGCFAT